MSVSALPVSSPDSAREVFLAAGMRLYPELGYQHLSVRLLAAEAGLSPGMFHHLFANKEAFVAEVLQRKYDAAFAELQLQVRPGRSVRENLRDALRFLAFFARAHQDWIVRVFSDAPAVAAIREFVRQYAGMRHVSLIIDLLARAERQGLLAPAAPRVIQKPDDVLGIGIAQLGGAAVIFQSSLHICFAAQSVFVQAAQTNDGKRCIPAALCGGAGVPFSGAAVVGFGGRFIQPAERLLCFGVAQLGSFFVVFFGAARIGRSAVTVLAALPQTVPRAVVVRMATYDFAIDAVTIAAVFGQHAVAIHIFVQGVQIHLVKIHIHSISFSLCLSVSCSIFHTRKQPAL